MIFQGTCVRLVVECTYGHFTHETESPWPLHFKHSHRWKRRSRSKFATSHYAQGTNVVCECKMCVKSTWIHVWHQIDHRSWSLGLFSNILLEVRLTQNQETMALQLLTTVDLFCFITCENPHEHKFIEIEFGWGPGHIMTSHYTWGSVTTLHNFEGILGRPSITFFWALTISWSRLLARVWSGP
jgi:hypothetical protein